ncbi:hypothetical protein FHR81_001806 [Actinoalloteichus hoggarensis]|nr:hypothetical protein [Actinoalloteichus hoggarensis]MBB5920768.1 hypothetical protein [Actinoalloteichus hoggarensis]
MSEVPSSWRGHRSSPWTAETRTSAQAASKYRRSYSTAIRLSP